MLLWPSGNSPYFAPLFQSCLSFSFNGKILFGLLIFTDSIVGFAHWFTGDYHGPLFEQEKECGPAHRCAEKLCFSDSSQEFSRLGRRSENRRKSVAAEPRSLY